MHWIDDLIFTVYFLVILFVGYYFLRKNKSREDYYVGSRNIGSTHVGLSIAATDVGGGFSIGLGGLGFTMGLSGTWLLFTGLVGAWMAAILTVPRLKKLDMEKGMLTFPDFLSFKYSRLVGLIAAIISGIGYVGFTAGQILAGGKLAAGSIFSGVSLMDPLLFSLIVMALVVVIYTSIGGLKAVIYTDTVQWIVLLAGLYLLGLPFAYFHVGGIKGLHEALPPAFFSLTNVSWVTLVNWAVSIVPIWFIAMTLYQRVYATRNVREAQRAFFIAGLFEYPMMAFSGVLLGMMARVIFPASDPEMALPRMLNYVLPVGVSGFVLASYFSAVMSTADSCLIAASGNIENDILDKLRPKHGNLLLRSIGVTALLGAIAFFLASSFNSVLDVVLHSYSFMVSGLLVPTLFAYFSKKPNSTAALVSMLGGGTTTIALIYAKTVLPLGLDPTLFGIGVSIILYLLTALIFRKHV